MPTQIKPSDSYSRFLVEPTHKPAPEHIKKLLSKYRITHFLGAGGFADVYEGTDENGWGVAVKVPQFKMEKTMDTDALKRFASEADIWKKLQHENIVNVYETGSKPLPHIVMELMEGGDLDGLMRSHELTVGEAVHILVQVLEGISYAHQMASVHRDLKPENILFTHDGIAKITDWGIGKYMASEGVTKTIDTKGTLAYSAPEQFDSQEYGNVDWQTDIFQLGILFYNMLTGVNPFHGKDMAEVMGKVLRYDPAPPSQLNQNIPPELDEIVLGALERYREDRWESSAVMLHELKLIIKGKVRIKRGERISRKARQKARKKVGVLDELDEYMAILEEEGIDISKFKQRMKPIDKYVQLRWYDKVEEEGNILLKDLKNIYRYVYEKKEAPIRVLINDVRNLFEDCLAREINVEDLYVLNNKAMEAFENRGFRKAEELFNELITELESIIFEEDRKSAAWEKFDLLVGNDHVFPPEGLEDLIDDDIIKAEEVLNNWEEDIDAAKLETEQRMREEKEARRREKEELRKIEKKKKEREEYKKQVYELKDDVKKLMKKCQNERFKLDWSMIRLEYLSCLSSIRKNNLKKAEIGFTNLREIFNKSLLAYRMERESAERARIREQRRIRRKKWIRFVFSSLVIVLLVCSSYGLYIWYTWDSDGDGVWDRDDAFPDDIAASEDTDGDGWPDKWNPGKGILDSTSKPKLYLDAFPDDPAANIDFDHDGYPDKWIDGKTEQDSTTGLHLDAFLQNSNEWADSDNDGYGDNKADAFPEDMSEWADSDGDGVGDNSDVAPKDNSIKYIDDLDLKWVNISCGWFWMGSSNKYGNDEYPRHQVTISIGFQMLKFEVTQAQWKAIMGWNPSHFSWDLNPVETVSWNDCQSFISKLNKFDPNHTYRLPTEAEWEYVCRAGSDTDYCYGNDSDQLTHYGWYSDNSNGTPHPVGEKKPNSWGLYDMHGNVWEWCLDWYDSDYYWNSPDMDPNGSVSGSDRVMRGDSWSNSAGNCRSADRCYYPLNQELNSIGLRLVRTEK